MAVQVTPTAFSDRSSAHSTRVRERALTMNKNPLRFLLPAALTVALLVSAAPHTSAAADDDTWYSAMVAGDACVPLAAVQQRIQTMLGFKVGPSWRTPSDVIYEFGMGGQSVRPVLITPERQNFCQRTRWHHDVHSWLSALPSLRPQSRMDAIIVANPDAVGGRNFRFAF